MIDPLDELSRAIRDTNGGAYEIEASVLTDRSQEDIDAWDKEIVEAAHFLGKKVTTEPSRTGGILVRWRPDHRYL